MAAKKKIWRESDVYAAIAKWFSEPAFVLLSQVRDSTGFVHSPRTADAIAVSVWPSRGLFLTGIEIKTNTADWRRELARPEKSAEIQQYCRHWYIASPKGLIDISTVPPTWGLLECDGRGCTTARVAPELKPEPPDMLLLCSILRNAARSSVPKSQVQQQIEKTVETQVEARVKSAAYNSERLCKDVAQFEAASGVKIAGEWSLGRVGKAVQVVMDGGLDLFEKRLRRLHAQSEEIVRDIAKQLTEISEPSP